MPDKSKSQLEKFKEAAREHECDEDEAAFEETLRQISQHKPEKERPAD